MDKKSAEEIRLKNMRYDIGMEMEDELIKCYAYNNNSNTSQLKMSQDKTRQDEIYIDSLHIMTTTITMTMIIIIQ